MAKVSVKVIMEPVWVVGVVPGVVAGTCTVTVPCNTERVAVSCPAIPMSASVIVIPVMAKDEFTGTGWVAVDTWTKGGDNVGTGTGLTKILTVPLPVPGVGVD